MKQESPNQGLDSKRIQWEDVLLFRKQGGWDKEERMGVGIDKVVQQTQQNKQNQNGRDEPEHCFDVRSDCEQRNDILREIRVCNTDGRQSRKSER